LANATSTNLSLFSRPKSVSTRRARRPLIHTRTRNSALRTKAGRPTHHHHHPVGCSLGTRVTRRPDCSCYLPALNVDRYVGRTAVLASSRAWTAGCAGRTVAREATGRDSAWGCCSTPNQHFVLFFPLLRAGMQHGRTETKDTPHCGTLKKSVLSFSQATDTLHLRIFLLRLDSLIFILFIYLVFFFELFLFSYLPTTVWLPGSASGVRLALLLYRNSSASLNKINVRRGKSRDSVLQRCYLEKQKKRPPELLWTEPSLIGLTIRDRFFNVGPSPDQERIKFAQTPTHARDTGSGCL
jgi:hypothetical protein